MSRLHLIEFHEQPWVPSLLRDCVTDYLRTATKIGGHYELIVELVQQSFLESGAASILDLGSGAGGGWPELQPALQTTDSRPVSVILSDRDPNLPAWEVLKKESNGAIDYIESSVDATQPGRGGFRTMFNLFHHFQKEDAQAILSDASEEKQPILIVEAMDNSIIQGILIVLLAPIMTLLLTPLIKPFRWGRLLFTYLIPIVPLMVAWDGLVSVIRLYSIDDLRKMTANLDGLEWEIGKKKQKGLVVMYAKGIPKHEK